jgi:lipopolysaccharide assembly protein A
MVRFLRLSLGVVALIVIMAFAIANRTPVPVGLAPLPGTIELPVYGVFLLGLVIGVLVGGIGVGLGAIPKRREARRMRNKAWALENQLSVIKGQQERREAERYAAPRSLPAQGAGA